MTNAIPSNARSLRMRRLTGAAVVAIVGTSFLVDFASAATKAVPKPSAKSPGKSAAKSATAKVIPTTFPSVKVIDLATSKTIDLATLNVTSKPQLVWFWAPS